MVGAAGFELATLTLLGSQPALGLSTRLYQRLLANNAEEAIGPICTSCWQCGTFRPNDWPKPRPTGRNHGREARCRRAGDDGRRSGHDHQPTPGYRTRRGLPARISSTERTGADVGAARQRWPGATRLTTSRGCSATCCGHLRRAAGHGFFDRCRPCHAAGCRCKSAGGGGSSPGCRRSVASTVVVVEDTKAGDEGVSSTVGHLMPP